MWRMSDISGVLHIGREVDLDLAAGDFRAETFECALEVLHVRLHCRAKAAQFEDFPLEVEDLALERVHLAVRAGRQRIAGTGLLPEARR